MQFERPLSPMTSWSAPGYRPHHVGPLWLLWRLGLAPSKRQADLILLFIIVASSAWSYLIIIDYTEANQNAFAGSVLTEEIFNQ